MANIDHQSEAAAAQVKLLQSERAQLVREIADAEKKLARVAVLETMINALSPALPPADPAPETPAPPAA